MGLDYPNAKCSSQQALRLVSGDNWLSLHPTCAQGLVSLFSAMPWMLAGLTSLDNKRSSKLGILSLDLPPY